MSKTYYALFTYAPSSRQTCPSSGLSKILFPSSQFDEKGANRLLHFQTSAISTLVIKRTEVPTLVCATLWLNG